jgi:antitoxin VapB
MAVDVAGVGRAVRREQLRELIDAYGLSAVVLRRPANFAWYTGGADNRVDRVARDGVADVLVTREGEYVLTSAIEAPRMRAEQTPEIEVVEHPWHEDGATAMRALAGPGPIGADFPVPGGLDVCEPVARLRRTLDAEAIARLRAVGADLADGLAEAALDVAPGVDEHDLAASIAAACRRRGLTAPVLLAAADERIERFRHPLPAGATVRRRAMLVASAERGGLYANLTRIVELDEPGPELARRLAATDEILGRMRDEATLPGRTLADAFADCRGFYADAGFPDEWKLHHQGGLTGYASREVIATPQSDHVIEPGQAFAWNPSITGAKAEETFVLTADGPEVVTGALR